MHILYFLQVLRMLLHCNYCFHNTGIISPLGPFCKPIAFSCLVVNIRTKPRTNVGLQFARLMNEIVLLNMTLELQNFAYV
jgi:hypothetical protein